MTVCCCLTTGGRREGQQFGTFYRHRSDRRHKSRRKVAGDVVYCNLARELKRLRKVKKVVRIVACAPGAVPEGLSKNLIKTVTTVSVELLQKVALQGRARIFRNVLDTGQGYIMRVNVMALSL